MVFLHKELIELAPFSKNTYYKRRDELIKEKKIKFTLKGNYLTESEAKKIADGLGFLDRFNEFIKNKKKN